MKLIDIKISSIYTQEYKWGSIKSKAILKVLEINNNVISEEIGIFKNGNGEWKSLTGDGEDHLDRKMDGLKIATSKEIKEFEEQMIVLELSK